MSADWKSYSNSKCGKEGNTVKRIISMVLAFALIFSCFSGATVVQAAETAGDDWMQENLVAKYSFAEKPDNGVTVSNLAPDSAIGSATVHNPGGWADSALIFNGTGSSNAAAGTWVELPDDRNMQDGWRKHYNLLVYRQHSQGGMIYW